MKTCKRSKSKYYTNLLHPRNPQLLILLPFQILQFLGSGFGKEDYLGISCYFLVTVSQDPIPSCISWEWARVNKLWNPKHFQV